MNEEGYVVIDKETGAIVSKVYDNYQDAVQQCDFMNCFKPNQYKVSSYE